MLLCKHKCNLISAIETLSVKKIVYNNPHDKNHSTFLPGLSERKRILSMRLKSDFNFPEGTEFELLLIGFYNNEEHKTTITPISGCKKLTHPKNNIKIEIEGEIPLPLNMLYMPTIVKNCDQDVCTSTIETGTAHEYIFILHIKCL